MPEATVPRILVFFDYACPFCYLDWPRLKRLRAEHGAELFLAPYELRPQMAPGSVPIGDIGAVHSERVEAHMRKMAAEGGLELTFPGFVPNTHHALALGEYARDLGPEAHEVLHEAIFAAYNGRGEDISNDAVLLAIAEDHALDRDDVIAAWGEGRHDERLHQFIHLGLSMGVTATPAALICNELMIGSRPYEVLEEALRGCVMTQADVERESAPAE